MEHLICRQIVASIDEEASGPSYSVTSLSAAITELGMDCSVLAVGRKAAAPGSQIFGQDLTGLPLIKRLMASGELARALDSIASQGAVLHSHGLWLLPNIYPAQSARRHGVPLVVSPRGMLGEQALSYSSALKKVMWIIVQRRALETVSCFHATSEAEYEDIRRMGLSAPIAVIPNGIHIPEGDPTPSRTILHLGRLHPKKGIDRLIAAWARVANRYPDWRLRIVGPSEMECRAVLERQVAQLGVPRVTFDDAHYGAAKWQAYKEAGLFVLPTMNDNFGMVVAEALASGVPTISTKGAPWEGLRTERCGWWVDQGAGPIAEALEEAMSLPDAARAEMGRCGRDWMRRDFGWDGIAQKMTAVYRWCLGQNETPDCVTT